MKFATLFRFVQQGVDRRWQATWTLLLVLAGGLLLSRNHADPDFWGHVQYGRDVLAHGLPQTATYTYTAVGFPWINHENIAEIFFAWAVDRWGASSLLALKVVTGWLLTGVLWWRIRRAGVDLLPATLLLVLTLLNLTYYWTLRPQWFTISFFVLLLWLLDDTANDDERVRSRGVCKVEVGAFLRTLRWLLWLGPPMFLVWANAHGGFVLGVCFLAAYLGVRCVELWRAYGRDARVALAGSAVVLGVILAATLINPYGWQLHRWLAYSLGKARPEISEWHPPGLWDAVFVPWWTFVAVSLLVVFFTPLKRDVVRVVLLALVLWQSLSHLRHIPFYALTFVWWYAADVGALWRKFGTRTSRSLDQEPHQLPSSVPRWLWAWAGVGGLVILILTIQQVSVIPVHRDRFPVDAVAFMAENRLHGRVVARFDWAQYLLEAFAHAPADQRITLAVDGRYDTCYPRWLLDLYFDFSLGDDPKYRNRGKNSPPYDPLRILELGHPDLVLIGCDEYQPPKLMPSQWRDWVLLYHDPIAEIWGRRSRYDDPQSPHYFPPEKRRIVAAVPRGYVPWPAWPQFPGS